MARGGGVLAWVGHLSQTIPRHFLYNTAHLKVLTMLVHGAGCGTGTIVPVCYVPVRLIPV
jgi:hypothetical protein